MKAIDLPKAVYLEKIYEEWDEDHTYMGTIGDGLGVYRYSTKGRQQWVYLVDEYSEQIVVECPLSKRLREDVICYHPDYTRTDSRYRGQELALKLYVFLISKGIIMQAGDQQSRGSQKLWYKLAKKRNIKVLTIRNGVWEECYPCDAAERVDCDSWDPYESNCITIAVKAKP